MYTKIVEMLCLLDFVVEMPVVLRAAEEDGTVYYAQFGRATKEQTMIERNDPRERGRRLGEILRQLDTSTAIVLSQLLPGDLTMNPFIALYLSELRVTACQRVYFS